MSKPRWKRQIINDLKKYKSYKADVKALEVEMELDYEGNMGMSYDQPSVTSSNIADFTGNKAINVLNSDKREEYKEKLKFIKKIDAYVESLPPAQQFIIKAKFYMREKDMNMDKMSGGGMRRDIDIYTHDDFKYSQRQYFRMRNRGYKILAKKMGYK